MEDLKLIRHETTGNVISAYRGAAHIGMIYCPVPAGAPEYPGHDDYAAVPSDPSRDASRFPTEEAAVAYLAA